MKTMSEAYGEPNDALGKHICCTDCGGCKACGDCSCEIEDTKKCKNCKESMAQEEQGNEDENDGRN